MQLKTTIKICFDSVFDTGDLKIGENRFNYNTLEPKLLKSNSLEKLNKIFDTTYTQVDDMNKYMKAHKTECALKIFESNEDIVFPSYILDAINE